MLSEPRDCRNCDWLSHLMFSKLPVVMHPHIMFCNCDDMEIIMNTFSSKNVGVRAIIKY